MSTITHAEVRMYRMGTGDCFAIKFLSNEEVKFKMMIDAGSWSGSKEHLTPFVKNLKAYLNDYADVLIVTHEHKDHVHAFDACEELFTDGQFNVGEIWMGWSEKDSDSTVINWKKEYGEKKKALGKAAEKLKKVIESDDYKKQFSGSLDGVKAMDARTNFSGVLTGFADLHMSVNDEKIYKGGLAGMDVVKNKIKKKDIKYHKPGDIITEFGEAEGIKMYVLGPPEVHGKIKQEAGGKGESYQHNDKLRESEAFSAAILNLDTESNHIQASLLPFDEHYALKDEETLKAVKSVYDANEWQKIDYDWLFSAGSFSLRMNGLTNNLSLAIAIEIAGKVMLFPGDAEFGSWASWHKINWKIPERETKDGREPKHFTEDLLNRTVFYKVAHHLSHNGTAQALGLEMMNDNDLVAMATLDYSVINAGWKGTMPNRAILDELLERTKGRLLIMNEDELFFDFNEEIPITQKIKEAQSRMTSKENQDFHNPDNLKKTDLFIQYKVNLLPRSPV